MANCPYVDQEKSGPSNGWYCSVVGGPVGSDFYSNYCSSSVSCEHCPHLGGDDRIRNPECLTEEVCSCILHSVTASLNYLERYIGESVSRIIEMVRKTGYTHLYDSICQAGNYYIEAPRLSGSIGSLVITEPERARARELEENLTQIFAQIQPGNYLPPSCYLGMPDLSSATFDQISDAVYTYGAQAYAAIAGSPVDTGGAAKFEKPVSEAQEMVGNQVCSYFGSLAYGIESARRTFESGCSETFSGRGNHRGYTGEAARWQA